MPYKDPIKRREANRRYMAIKRANPEFRAKEQARVRVLSDVQKTSQKVYRRLYYQNHLNDYATPEFKEKRKISTRKWRKENNEEYRKYSRLRLREVNQRKRKDILSFLGGTCKTCGITDHRVLQIDHVNGGGNKEWKNVSFWKRYKMVYDNPTAYQLLCANCNWIKRHENKEVPTLDV